MPNTKSPTPEPALDTLDRQILAELQEDGRMTNVELARRVNLSAPPCLRRVRRLEEEGIIRGYHADIDAAALGWEVMFFALVGLESQKQSVLDAFEALATSWPEVRECHMIRGGGGSIINMGSSYGIRCEPGFLAYAASKEAIRALTRTAAREWGQHKIRVNTILPSALSPKAQWYLEETGTYDMELAKVALGRFGSPDDIAPLALFLASDVSHYITGQTIGADGGSTMF